MTQRTMNASTRMITARGVTMRQLTMGALAILVAAFASPAFGADTMVLGAGGGDPGDTGVTIPVSFTMDDAMQGYSVAVAYDTTYIDCTDVTEIGGYAPEYFQFTIDDAAGTIVVGAILDIDPTASAVIPASPTTPVDMVELTFDVDEAALPGPVDLELTNGAGDPPVENVFSVDGADVLVGSLTNESFTITNPNEFSFADVSPTPGLPFEAVMRCTHPESLQGFSVEITYDPGDLTVDEITLDGVTGIIDANQSCNPALTNAATACLEFVSTDIDNDAGIASVAIVFDFLPPFSSTKVLGSGTDQALVEFICLPDGTLNENDTTSIDFFQGEIGNLITYLSGAVALTPVLTGQLFTFGEPPTGNQFVRGNINGTGVVDLGDAIYALNYLFSDGGTPPCLDAADVNDDDSVDLADAIRMINWMFLDGDQPESPYPNCGFDPTDNDGVTCLDSPAACE